MERSVTFLEAFKLFFKNYVNFTGRSRRAEYWYWILWSFIISTALFIPVGIGFILLIFGAESNNNTTGVFGIILLVVFGILAVVYLLGTIIPMIALTIRRFHDTGRTMVMPIVYYALSLGYNFFNPKLIYQNTDSVFLWLISLIFALAYIGVGIYVFVITLLKSQPEDNKYGRGPAGIKFEQGHTPTSHKSYSEASSSSHHSHSDY